MKNSVEEDLFRRPRLRREDIIRRDSLRPLTVAAWWRCAKDWNIWRANCRVAPRRRRRRRTERRNRRKRWIREGGHGEGRRKRWIRGGGHGGDKRGGEEEDDADEEKEKKKRNKKNKRSKKKMIMMMMTTEGTNSDSKDRPAARKSIVLNL
jgi:hypothetical protein